MTAAGRPWSRRSASAGDALFRARFSRRTAELSLPLRPAAGPELRRVPDRPHARGARDPARHRPGARAVVRRGVLTRIRRSRGHGIRVVRLAGAIAGMARTHPLASSDRVGPVPARPLAPGAPDARAAAPAHPHAL